MNISTGMILAAGLGKRLRPYTLNLPKPLIKIGKKTLIENIINKLEGNGFKKVVINLYYSCFTIILMIFMAMKVSTLSFFMNYGPKCLI